MKKAIEFGVYVKDEDSQYYPMPSLSMQKHTMEMIDLLFERLKEVGGNDIETRVAILDSKAMFMSSVILQTTFNRLTAELVEQNLVTFDVPLNS
jgi:hypothetical protein